MTQMHALTVRDGVRGDSQGVSRAGSHRESRPLLSSPRGRLQPSAWGPSVRRPSRCVPCSDLSLLCHLTAVSLPPLTLPPPHNLGPRPRSPPRSQPQSPRVPGVRMWTPSGALFSPSHVLCTLEVEAMRSTPVLQALVTPGSPGPSTPLGAAPSTGTRHRRGVRQDGP